MSAVMAMTPKQSGTRPNTLKGLQKQFDKAEGCQSAAFAALFSEEFMKAHSGFDSFEQMLEAAPWQIEAFTDLLRIPGAGWDRFVDTYTDFGTWREMLSAGDRWD